MDPRVFELPPYASQKDRDLLLGPAQDVAKQAEREGLQPREDLDKVVRAQLLELRVLRPRPHGYIDLPGAHVLEASSLHPALELGARAGVAAEPVGAAEQGGEPP